MVEKWTLRWKSHGWIPRVRWLRPGSYVLGRGKDCAVRIDVPSVSSAHARLDITPEECWLFDLGSTNGTKHRGLAVEAVRLSETDVFRLGEIEFSLRPTLNLRQFYFEQKFSLVSIAIHAALIVLLARGTLFPKIPKQADFEADSSSGGFLQDPGPKSEPPGGEAAAGVAMPDILQLAVPAPSAALSMLTTTAPSALNLAVPVPVAASAPKLAAASGGLSGGGGGASYRSAGLGKGSGIGKGVGEWVGGGAGGIGISGRGKTLKTINEFSVYFVIHSGDWYAALDTRLAPDGRQKEESPPGLADEKYIDWLNWKPVPNTGPFVNYWWGIRDVRGGEDNRQKLVEFTPGAMGNLLRFVRQASAGAIKGAAKPSAVVLDKALVPYSYNSLAKQSEWNAEGREKFRETLRKGLPAFDSIYGTSFGYIWNPKPEDRAHPDFTVEYLLDVKPMPPFIYFTGNDDFVLSETEVDTLYQYILRGGAIWGDSGFAGDRSKFNTAFKREMKRVIPDVDKPFRALKKENDLFLAGPDAYFDKSNGFDRLPHGMQFYDAPIETIEVLPGVVSVVLTKNAYGNFLRFETTVINNRFQIGGDIGRGQWASTMWKFREKYFRGLNEPAIIDSYKLGSNVLVYMLGRWPAMLNRPENKGMLQ